MKFLALIFLMTSFSAFAGDACQGIPGECLPVVMPKPAQTIQGACAGILMKAYVCTVVFVSQTDGSAMNITCKNSAGKEILNQDMQAEVAFYQQGVSVSNNGKDDFITDGKTYADFTNGVVDLNFSVEGTAISNPGLSLTLQSGTQVLTNVVCQ